MIIGISIERVRFGSSSRNATPRQFLDASKLRSMQLLTVARAARSYTIFDLFDLVRFHGRGYGSVACASTEVLPLPLLILLARHPSFDPCNPRAKSTNEGRANIVQSFKHLY